MQDTICRYKNGQQGPLGWAEGTPVPTAPATDLDDFRTISKKSNPPSQELNTTQDNLCQFPHQDNKKPEKCLAGIKREKNPYSKEGSIPQPEAHPLSPSPSDNMLPLLSKLAIVLEANQPEGVSPDIKLSERKTFQSRDRISKGRPSGDICHVESVPEELHQ
ncbi:hypothetical protein MG293_005780 [Ovis ammon polii]|uniref:Uncharacterized protein n=1 Tax=Ovis ammon polii TaxID=230172 RepID=A0AAD4YEX0_OVIAM|nr:hypothetical protein MG293_005780 [Ovis ammon polii]